MKQWSLLPQKKLKHTFFASNWHQLKEKKQNIACWLQNAAPRHLPLPPTPPKEINGKRLDKRMSKIFLANANEKNTEVEKLLSDSVESEAEKALMRQKRKCYTDKS